MTAAALASVRPHLVTVGVISAGANLLLLTGPLYMFQIYDRVLASGSIPTLLVLSAIALTAFAFLGVLDWIRLKMMARIATLVEARLFTRAFPASLERSRFGVAASGEPDPVDDVEQVRQYLTTNGPVFLFDLPWLPIFLAFVYLLHPVLGLAATAGAAVLVVLTLVNERIMRARSAAVNASVAERRGLVRSAQHGGEAAIALGMGAALLGRIEALGAGARRDLIGAADTAVLFATATKTFRMVLQSALLGTGAVLAVAGEVSPGAMIVASTIAARALAPVEQVVGGWRQLMGFREAWGRLSETLGTVQSAAPALTLPAPQQRLTVAGLALVSPASERPVLHGISFELTAGHGLSVIGPSASGKTSLARALTGLWRPAAGAIQLDGARLDQWPADRLGRHVGYLPQRVEMFAGTVAENIARFAPDAPSQAIIEAAEAANVHEMVLALPKGYETPIGGAAHVLSVGQMQRIGLARALYGKPFLVVLDEPNAALDHDGEDALRRSIAALRKRGAIVVVMTHRPSVTLATDFVLVLNGGVQHDFGPRDEVFKKIAAPMLPKREAA